MGRAGEYSGCQSHRVNGAHCTVCAVLHHQYFVCGAALLGAVLRTALCVPRRTALVGSGQWAAEIGVVWCGVMWCDVVWCGVVWCGVVWCGVVWCAVVWCGVVWCGVVPLYVLLALQIFEQWLENTEQQKKMAFCWMPSFSGISPSIMLPGLHGIEGLTLSPRLWEVCRPPFQYPERSSCVNDNQKDCECLDNLEEGANPGIQRDVPRWEMGEGGLRAVWEVWGACSSAFTGCCTA